MNTDNKEQNPSTQGYTTQAIADSQPEILLPLQTAEKKKSLCRMIFDIIGNGSVGSCTIIISLLILSSENAIIGNIQDSTTYIIAKENTNVILRNFLTLITYFNMGLLICISRCLSINDHMGVDHFIKMNFWFLRYSSLITIALIVLYIWLCSYWYEGENLKWTRF